MDTQERPMTLSAHVAVALGWRFDPTWRNGVGTWRAPDGTVHAAVPDYEHDLNLALGLFPPDEISFDGGLTICSVSDYPNKSRKWAAYVNNEDMLVGDSPASAVCLAWLAWKEARS